MQGASNLWYVTLERDRAWSLSGQVALPLALPQGSRGMTEESATATTAQPGEAAGPEA